MFTAWCIKGIYYVIFVFHNIFCSSVSVVLVFVPPSVVWVLFFLSSVCLLRTLSFSLEGIARHMFIECVPSPVLSL